MTRYLDADSDFVEERRDVWEAWTSIRASGDDDEDDDSHDSWDRAVGEQRNAFERERFRRSKILRTMRPREPAVGADPLSLGYQAHKLVGLLRRSISLDFRKAGYLDELEELIRRLAWGPDDGERARIRARGSVRVDDSGSAPSAARVGQ